MLVFTQHQFRDLIRTTYPRLLEVGAIATAVVAGHQVFHWDIAISAVPVAALGTAVAFYVGFKNNQAYDRFWEGRKIWGGIVNGSRAWGASVLDFIRPPGAAPAEARAVERELLYRHLAWINALRLSLRGQPDWEPVLAPFLAPEELAELKGRPNVAAALLRTQSRRVEALVAAGALASPVLHLKLRDAIRECYDQQGMCERIRNTPLVPHYTITATIFVWLYIVLVPFTLLDVLPNEAGLVAIPIATLVGWVYDTMDRIGKLTENPFSGSPMDVPMSALCRSIEIELRDMLGERPLPEPLQPVRGVLM